MSWKRTFTALLPGAKRDVRSNGPASVIVPEQPALKSWLNDDVDPPGRVTSTVMPSSTFSGVVPAQLRASFTGPLP